MKASDGQRKQKSKLSWARSLFSKLILGYLFNGPGKQVAGYEAQLYLIQFISKINFNLESLSFPFF